MAPTDSMNPRAPAIWGSIWSVWGIAALTVILRFKARSIRGLSWASDDWMSVVALFFSFCVCIASSLGARFGVGEHIWDVPQEQLEEWNKSLFYGNIVYVATGPSIKMCALLMYQRVFASSRFRAISWSLVAVCAAWWIGETLGSIWNCVPISGFWDKSINARCIKTRDFDLQYAIINISLDAIILALPVRMVMGLQLSNTQKLAFVLLFLMGGFATVAAIIRLLIFIRNLKSTDETYVWFEGVIWSCLEPCIGVISVCLPLMRPIILAALPESLRQKFLSKTNSLFKGGNTSNRQSTIVSGTFTSSHGRKAKRTIDDCVNDRSFMRLDSDDIPLDPVHRAHTAQAVGTQALERPEDVEVAIPDAIFKRTDIVTQVDQPRM